MLKTLTDTIPINTLSKIGINSAEIALNYAQGNPIPPIRFVAGYNLKHVIKFEFKGIYLIVKHNAGQKCIIDILKNDTEEYKEAVAFLETQKVLNVGEIAKVLNYFKPTASNE